jgi:2-oxoglutarate dehydrogenase E2 component (dihydrolipoamide succinyltransferase)
MRTTLLLAAAATSAALAATPWATFSNTTAALTLSTPLCSLSLSADDDSLTYVTPLVRRLAQQQGVDLAKVKGSGVGGRIRKEDVLAAAAARLFRLLHHSSLRY